MNKFEREMGRHVDWINADLAARFDGGHPYQGLMDAMAYSLLSGGKRIRGVMTLAFYRLFDEDCQKALPFASAIEMIHAYSLIHDDLPCMDDDDLRRGRPACHIAFGESTALLAGDALQSMAFEAAAAVRDLPADRVREALGVLARAAGVHGMAGGQAMDLAGEGKRLSVRELDAINQGKTGALFRACAGMGCALGGADSAQAEAAEEYARCVGLAFQIADDVLDVTADPDKLGKPVGSDADNRKNTYAAVCGVDECRRLTVELAERAKQSLAMFAEAEFLKELADWLTGRES